MDIQTSPDPVARARELGAETAAAADEIERTRRIPEALLGRLEAAWDGALPPSLGGRAGRVRELARAMMAADLAARPSAAEAADALSML